MASCIARKLLLSHRSLPLKICARSFIYSSKKGMDRDSIAKLQQPIDLSYESIMGWVKRKRWESLKHGHRFIKQRHESLGPNLATAHFVLGRGGSVKFLGSNKWHRKTADDKILLPNTRVDNINVEAVDVSGSSFMYESFDNMVELEHLRYLNLSNCEHVTDWCLDRFPTLFRNSLEFLDLSGCPKITEKGIASLHRLPNLRQVVLKDMPALEDPVLTAIMFEDSSPLCTVVGIDLLESGLNEIGTLYDSETKSEEDEELASLSRVN